MWKIIIFVACLISATVANASIEDILGEWVSVAIYPEAVASTIVQKRCRRATYTRNSGNLQCTDDRKIELIDIQAADLPGVYTAGVLMVEDAGLDVIAKLNVTCTHEGKMVEPIVAAKLINRDYVMFYRQGFNDKAPFNVFIDARKVPTRSELMTAMNNVAEFSGKSPALTCTKD